MLPFLKILDWFRQVSIISLKGEFIQSHIVPNLKDFSIGIGIKIKIKCISDITEF